MSYPTVNVIVLTDFEHRELQELLHNHIHSKTTKSNYISNLSTRNRALKKFMNPTIANKGQKIKV